MSYVELSTVIEDLEYCLALAKAHNGTSLDVDAAGGRRRPEVAAVSRDLLSLSDRLSLLSGLVRQEYWSLKGEPRVGA